MASPVPPTDRRRASAASRCPSASPGRCGPTPRSGRSSTSTDRRPPRARAGRGWCVGRRIARTHMTAAPAIAASAPELTPEWVSALDGFDADLRRRAVAAKTRRAYAIDTRQFARWAGDHGLSPRGVDVRALRRYVASLTEAGQAPTTVARKLAALR